MKPLPTQCDTINAATGKIEKSETVTMGIMPPRPGVCSVCAVDHKPADPHNAQSMYYQYSFYGEHGRWPTWADAVAHCTEGVRMLWQLELKRMKAWTAPEGFPIAQPYSIQT